MNQVKSLCLAILVVCVFSFCGQAEGHSIFKKRMEAAFPKKKISCNACHVEKKPKTERGAYGKLFSKTFESKTLTADWKALKGAEKKAFEKEKLGPEFDKAYEKIKAMTFQDLVEAGVIAGITEKEEE